MSFKLLYIVTLGGHLVNYIMSRGRGGGGKGMQGLHQDLPGKLSRGFGTFRDGLLPTLDAETRGGQVKLLWPKASPANSSLCVCYLRNEKGTRHLK